jgi:hypothetical protein
MILQPDLQTKLARLDAHFGRDPQALPREAVERFDDHDVLRFEKGLTAIERGAAFGHEAEIF